MLGKPLILRTKVVLSVLDARFLDTYGGWILRQRHEGVTLFPKKILKKSTFTVMIKIIITFGKQIFW